MTEAPTIDGLTSDLKKSGVVPPRGAFQVEELTASSVRLTHLSDEGATRDEAQALSTRLVKATIDALSARGANPRTKHTTIVAEVFVAGPQSVTGGERVASLGHATYAPDADAITFDAPSDAPHNPPSSGDPKLDAARIAVRRYALEAFPAWQEAHPSACPKKLDELNALARRGDSLDPWGAPYQMLCGDDLPAGSPPIAVISTGPDKKPGTADDVKSWD